MKAWSRKKRSYITVLDIGTSKICCLMVHFDNDGIPEVIGLGYAPAKGIKNGVIVDLDKATDCIGVALAEAEKMAEREIKSVVVNITSSSLKSHHLFSEMEIEEGHQITAGDVKRLVDEALVSLLTPEQEIIHQFPLSYTLDGEKGVADPRDLYGHKLGVHLHVITLPESQSRNLVAVLDRCHVSIEAKVATPYACGLAVLTEEEKDIGAAVIDFGAGTTSTAVFLNGCLVHLGNVPIGGNTMTRDIAQGLSTSLAVAERLKTLNGYAFLSPKDELERLIVPVLGDDKEANLQIPRSNLISIIVPRLEEILEQTAGILDADPSVGIATHRLVLSGGGAALQGLKEKTASVLDAVVRLGRAPSLKGISEQYENYTFSTCIGLLRYIMMRNIILMEDHLQGAPKKKGLLRKVMAWLEQNF